MEAESYDCRCPGGHKIGHGGTRCQSASESRSVGGEPSDSPCICSGAQLCESGRDPSIGRRNSPRAELASESGLRECPLGSGYHSRKTCEDCAFPGRERKSTRLL